MDDEIKKCRILAVQRFKAGENPESICASLDKSKFWLYKWVKHQAQMILRGLKIVPASRYHPVSPI